MKHIRQVVLSKCYEESRERGWESVEGREGCYCRSRSGIFPDQIFEQTWNNWVSHDLLWGKDCYRQSISNCKDHKAEMWPEYFNNREKASMAGRKICEKCARGFRQQNRAAFYRALRTNTVLRQERATGQFCAGSDGIWFTDGKNHSYCGMKKKLQWEKHRSKQCTQEATVVI